MRRVVHEMRNHLAVAVANLEAFYDGVLEPTPERLRAVLQALREVDALVDDLPAAPSTPAALAMHDEEFNVCRVIANELTAFEALANERSVAFHVDRCLVTDRACGHFRGDPVRVAEIVANVVGNAIRYTAPGASVHVDCRRGADQIALEVTDGGPGIAPDEVRRIFEPGYRGAAAAGTDGTGQGLTLAARFVADHGGHIAVEDAPGGGARFVIALPTEPPDPAGRSVISLL